MTVKQLIKQLKKMPQNLEVFSADHDHGEWEVNGPIFAVNCIVKSEYVEYTSALRGSDKDIFESMPDKYVTIHP